MQSTPGNGQVAEWWLSNQPDLLSITKLTDIYISSQNVWVSDHPWPAKGYICWGQLPDTT